MKFILAPIANVWLYKFFVNVLGMNAFSYILTWTTPGTISLIVATGFAKLSFFLATQMASMFDELKHDCDEKGVPAATCSGAN